MRLLVTGGCGFIGSNFVRHVLSARPGWRIVVLDALTYAGNPDNLRDLEGDRRYEFVKGSIVDEKLVDRLAGRGFDAVLNFAAESHVDRSLYGPVEFARTNVQGTVVLLEAVRRRGIKRFVQISTDEVYGSLPAGGLFTEESPLRPGNPYSASKAAADLMVEAFVRTFGIDAVITRSSNNYGPYQHPEKFIPLFITSAMEGRECPIYGDGMQVRDWLHVEDNCSGVLAALERGRAGGIYNLGGGNERTNLDVARSIMRLVGRPEALIRPVADRPGHDRRYALDASKARRELGWAPVVPFEKGLKETVDWYSANGRWVARAKSGEYRRHYERHYGRALAGAPGRKGCRAAGRPAGRALER